MFLSKQGIAVTFFVALFAMLAGCGNGTKTTTAGATATVTTAAATIALSTSATTVKSDNSNSATITITVLDANNATMAGQAVSLTASTGQLSASTATTGASGTATVTFSGGTTGTNRTATITATATGAGVTSSIPIQITGSSIALSTLAATAPAGTATDVTAIAKNSAGTAMPSQSLRFSIATSSTGSGTLSASTATTNASGSASVNLTGTAAGIVNVLVEWLDAAGSVTASATQAYTITAAGGAFQVTTPATSPFSVSIGTNQSVVVSVPATVTSIRYATTLGTWLANGAKVLTVVNPGTGTDTQTFVPGASAGNASVQIDALDAAGKVTATAKLVFAISATAASSASIKLQPSAAVLQPSTGSTSSTSTLTATVYDAAKNAVGGASVLFELLTSSGTGETINPVVVSTDSTGVAQSTFTAGTLSTTQNSQIQASVVGTVIKATTSITVGGTAGSIAIGVSTTSTAVNNNTAYATPVTVMVTDSNGSAVSGATVSLSIWPVKYYKGVRDTACKAATYGPFLNEDLNENLLVDAGEDVDGPGGYVAPVAPATTPTVGLGTPDGKLWPVPAAAGSVPATITTGVDGTATFTWTYLKQYANWVTARIRATTLVQGSQSTSSIDLPLTPLASDVTTPCPLPSSPFN